MIEHGIMQLLDNSYIGKARPEIKKDLISLQIQKHLIFYHVGTEYGVKSCYPDFAAATSTEEYLLYPKLNSSASEVPGVSPRTRRLRKDCSSKKLFL